MCEVVELTLNADSPRRCGRISVDMGRKLLMKYAARIAIWSAACALIPQAVSSAHAWGRDGHRAVCHIAWTSLADSTRGKILDLLDIKTETEFADSCYWADEVRAERPETASWHYVNVPKAARSVDLARDCPKPASCVVEQIERHAEIVASDAPKAERAEALKFLAHFVGDLHQPLNIGYAEDGGGNRITGMFRGQQTDMRYIWDIGLLETLVPTGVDAAGAISKAAWLRGRSGGTERKTPLDWANDTLWITLSPATGYVGNPGGGVFDDIYIRQNRTTALAQIDRAGARLAHLLNAALK